MGRQPPISLEPLESRRLLSITLTSHILHVTGQLSLPDNITVGLGPGGGSVISDVKYTTKKGTVVDQTKSFPLADVGMVVITSGNKNDTILIDQTNGAFPVSTRIHMHNGNDLVTTGDEADRIYCGSGYDTVNSGNGNDTLFGGHGVDSLTAGNGNNYIKGGIRGHSIITAGAGDNILIDPFGHDTLMAGSGKDVFVVKNLKLDPVNSYDATKDKVHRYVPPANSADDDEVENDILNYLWESLL